jgi:hypothetical protein
MKLVLIVFNFIYDDSVRAIIERLKIPGFTEVPRVFGTGESGKRFGTHAFPGHAGLTDRAKRHGGIKAFVLPVEQMI